MRGARPREKSCGAASELDQIRSARVVKARNYIGEVLILLKQYSSWNATTAV
jgi:hypothetical protein